MQYRNVSIASVGYDLPPSVLSSAAIEDRLASVYQRIGLVAGRLEMMTGIRERRFWERTVRPSEVAARAGAAALEGSPVAPERIGCLIHASVCRDFLEPATANVVHDRLSLPSGAAVFDVSNACLGVLNGMLLIANMIELGQIEAGMVVAGENGKPLVDSTVESLLADETVTRKSIKKAFASLTIGSGAVAVLLARSDLVPDGHRLLGGTVRAATEHHELCRGGAVASNGAAAASVSDAAVGSDSDLGMATDAEALLAAGIDLARANWAGFRETVPGEVDRVLTHQVGKAHHRALFEALGLPLDQGYVTYDRLGNVGSVSLPVSLALAAEDGWVRPGQLVALLGIGSGLSSIMMGVRW